MGIRESVEAAIREVFPRFRHDLTDETTAADVPGWDSFKHVELMFNIEDRLGCEIEVAGTYGLNDIGALVQYLETTHGKT